MRLLTLVAIPLLATACKPPAPPGAGLQMPPPQVTVATIVPQDIPLAFEYLGRTEGSREVEVRARVTGFLESRHFVEGAMVQQGDLLFTIDEKPLRAQAEYARAELDNAQARADQAAREAARLEPLIEQEAVSRKERDDALSAAQIATASLASAKARLAQVELDLTYARVTAPMAGKIGRALRPEGSLVDTGDQGLLTTLLQLDPIYVSFHRTENQQFALDRDAASGRLQPPAEGKFAVELQHRDGTVLASGGAIDFIGGRLDTNTGTIPMRATLPNPALVLRAGQAVKVVLRGAVLRGAIAVPQRAVVDGAQGKLVLLAVSKDGKTVFEPRLVEVGEWVDLPGQGPAARAWVIRSGLGAGDRVILDNLARLTRMPPGLPIEVLPAPVADAGPGSNGQEGR